MIITINFKTKEICYDNSRAIKHINNILHHHLANEKWTIVLMEYKVLV